MAPGKASSSSALACDRMKRQSGGSVDAGYGLDEEDDASSSSSSSAEAPAGSTATSSSVKETSTDEDGVHER